jgi:hypothetical protein
MKTRKVRNTPNWDDFLRQKMFVPFFIYGRDDLDVGTLEGFCRGYGGVTGCEKSYQDTIGIYTAEGVYYNLLIDTRLACAVPMFFIDGKAYFYPIVACLTVCGGLPVIDPATGIMRTPSGNKP